jgi:hypothetical protein
VYETHHDSWDDNVIHATVQVADASNIRDNRQDCALSVTIGNTNLPAFLSNGVLYVQAPLGLFFEAFAENVSDFVRDMEIRVSDSRGRALPLDGNGRPVHRKRVAKSGVVRRGRKS